MLKHGKRTLVFVSKSLKVAIRFQYMISEYLDGDRNHVTVSHKRSDIKKVSLSQIVLYVLK